MAIPGGAESIPAQRAVLIILDGWGLAPAPKPQNPILLEKYQNQKIRIILIYSYFRTTLNL